MTHANQIDRRRVLAAVAAVPAAAVLSAPAPAAAGDDAELRRLWPLYLEALATTRAAYRVARAQRERSAYDSEFERLRRKPENERRFGEIHRELWSKFGLGPLHKAAHAEDIKFRRIVDAIRSTKAETPFGIGVKLSAWKDWDHIGDEEFIEVIDDVRRDLANLIGVDFIAATGELEV
jgi:hypothetical protein